MADASMRVNESANELKTMADGLARQMGNVWCMKWKRQQNTYLYSV